MTNNSVVTIGCFDGMHLGHRGIINYMIENSGPSRDSYLLTFDPHPHLFFSEKKTDFSISSLTQRFAVLHENFPAVDMMVVMDFSKEFSELSAEDFVRDFIFENLQASLVIVGEDFKFGHKCNGDVQFLKSLEEKYGYQVQVIEDICDDYGHRYSSTNIRNLIRSAEIGKAKEQLGYYWQVESEVIHGKKRGLVYPTANLDIGSYVWPKFGVYAVRIILENKAILPGVANFGFCPTFRKELFSGNHIMPEDVALEVHILNGFCRDIYGQKIKVDFIDFIREEEKFDSKFLLEERIDEDCRASLSIFENLN